MLQYSYPLKGIRSNIMKQESFNRFESNGDIDLNFCGTEICAPDFYAPPAIREEYLIHYILSGSGVFQTPSGIYQIHTGDIFLIYPGIPISYRANPLDPFHFSWIGFSGSRIPKVLNGLHFSKENCVRHLHSRYAFHDRIMQCIAQLDSPSSTNEYQLLSDLLWVFSQIKNSYDADVLVRDHRNEIKEHVEKAMTYIRLNYSHQIQVKNIALYVGLERSYFSKIIPAENSGEYFGIYDIFAKGASFIGSAVIAAVKLAGGTINIAVASLAVFFLIGFVFLRISDKQPLAK